MSIIVRNDDVKGIERKLTEGECSTVRNALHVARERFIENAAECRKVATEARAVQHAPSWAGVAYDRLAKQFDVQAEECSALYETFEEGA